MVSPSLEVRKVDVIPFQMQMLIEKVDRYKELIADELAQKTPCLNCGQSTGGDPEFCSLECANRY